MKWEVVSSGRTYYPPTFHFRGGADHIEDFGFDLVNIFRRKSGKEYMKAWQLGDVSVNRGDCFAVGSETNCTASATSENGRFVLNISSSVVASDVAFDQMDFTFEFPWGKQNADLVLELKFDNCARVSHDGKRGYKCSKRGAKIFFLKEYSWTGKDKKGSGSVSFDRVDDETLQVRLRGSKTMSSLTYKMRVSVFRDDSEPNSSEIINCDAISSPLELLTNKLYHVPKASSGNLCLLAKVETSARTSEEFITPLGRTYDGFPWETLPPFHLDIFPDESSSASCCLSIPEAVGNERYYLYHFSHELSEQEEVSRFLTQATFGATVDSIKNYMTASPAISPSRFLKNQMEDEAIITEHRKLFRSRSFGQVVSNIRHGIARHPCTVGSRWRNFALVQDEGGLTLTIESTIGGAVLLKVNGIPRTEYNASSPPTRSIWVGGELGHAYEPLEEGVEYWAPAWAIKEQLGGSVRIQNRQTGGQFLELTGGNPPVQLLNREFYDANITEISLTVEEKNNFLVINEMETGGAELALSTSDLTDSESCDSIPTLYPQLEPIFVQINSTWYLNSPGLAFLENTAAKPIPDGGGAIEILDPKNLYCSSAPRTFLNEHGCVLSSKLTACGGVEILVDEDVEDPLLNELTLSNLHELSGRYVYIVEGLRVDSSYGALRNPCSSNVISRWKKTGSSSSCVEGTFPDPETYVALTSALLDAQGNSENENLIDIIGPGCTVDPVLYGITIIFDGDCYVNVHQQENNVYDFTFWAQADTHRGNKGEVPNPITRFAEPTAIGVDPTFILSYPDHHDMDRWELNHEKFAFVGRAGDRISYDDLPEDLQTIHVANYFGTLGALSAGVDTVVCGSPGEVANGDPTLDDLTQIGINGGVSRQRSGLFYHAALKENDQLRQRVAWALSQILVISPIDVDAGDMTEVYLAYFDIFVRHAFGNYFDILKEVAFSPMMGEMLSFIKSRSTQHAYEGNNGVIFPDENFAREIMQLFSIGLVKLYPNGTEVLDENSGAPIENYDNEDIMTGARLWTGFDRQASRSNTESSHFTNRLDPMLVVASYRDRYPKMNLYDGYVGDGYPLCADLPSKPFLSNGAKYRLLGETSRPEMRYEPSKWATNENVSRFILDKESNLYAELCSAPAENELCTFPSVVTLDRNLECYEAECGVDTVSVVKMGGLGDRLIHYEYIPQPCVQLSFLSNAKKVQNVWGTYVCGNPKEPIAASSCCSRDEKDDLTWWSTPTYCDYVGEHMTFEEAERRCVAHDQFHCETSTTRVFRAQWENFCALGRAWYWSADSCETKAKIDLTTGKLAVAHKAPDSPYKELSPVSQVHENMTVTWFRVHWEDGKSLPETCETPCEVLEFDGSCLCPTTTVETPVFEKRPTDLSDVSSSNLHIGSLSPDTFDNGEFVAGTWSEGDKTVNYWTHSESSGEVGDMRTIFEVTEKGVTKYYRNMKSTVEVQIGGNTYWFRNAPHFNSMQDLNLHDALDETDAYLHHLIYHDNTAPFIAIRLMQRFGFSNPSARFVGVVTSAFNTGKYVSSDGEEFGSGKVGDLAATVAAILLDREARSFVLDADPFYSSLKEPLMRILQFMRAMEFELNPDTFPAYPLLRLSDTIGQEAFGFETVFSFFLPEFSPAGVLSSAQLLSPEATLLNSPTSVGLVRGLFSLVKYGLSTCEGDWVPQRQPSCSIPEGDYSRSKGRLTYSPGDLLHHQTNDPTPEDIVDEIGLLLAPGRLSPDNRQTMINALNDVEEDINNPAARLRLAQQLFATAPEFHVLNAIRQTDEPRPPRPPRSPPSKGYKAIVFFVLSGGADTYNLLVPYGDCERSGKDMYAHYSDIRGDIALKKSDLLPINATGSNQVCDTFGVHPSAPYLKTLYNEGDLSFLANTGVLHKFSDKTNYRENHKTQLFAHNVMQRETQMVDPFDMFAGTGVLGRLAARLLELASPYLVNSISLYQNNALVGEPDIAPTITSMTTSTPPQFDPRPSHENMPDLIDDLNSENELASSLFGETWSSTLVNGIEENGELRAVLEASQLGTEDTWDRDSDIEKQLEVVARMINVSNIRGTERDLFLVHLGGWDSHSNLELTLLNKLPVLNEAIEGFVTEMKAQNRHDHVLTVVTSEFGRTLTPNSGKGSDHAWGGNYALIGGSIDGGKIHGTYPDDLSDNGPLGLGRGRLVPTTSWEQVWNGISEWFGITGATDLEYILPNRNNFLDYLFKQGDLFK